MEIILITHGTCLIISWIVPAYLTKTYLQTHECHKTEGPMPIGDYTNAYERRLHLFMPKVFGKQKIP